MSLVTTITPYLPSLAGSMAPAGHTADCSCRPHADTSYMCTESAMDPVFSTFRPLWFDPSSPSFSDFPSFPSLLTLFCPGQVPRLRFPPPVRHHNRPGSTQQGPCELASAPRACNPTGGCACHGRCTGAEIFRRCTRAFRILLKRVAGSVMLLPCATFFKPSLRAVTEPVRGVLACLRLRSSSTCFQAGKRSSLSKFKRLSSDE